MSLLPYADTNEQDHVIPWVTYGLIALNVFFFLVEVAQGSAIETFIDRWSVIPIEYRDHTDYPPTIPLPYWFTIFSAMFLHGGLLHLAGNMVYLGVFGDNIENALGHLRFLLFYLVCGVAAAALYIATNLDSNVPSLGASGAIAGVLGAYLVLYPGNTIHAWLTIFRVRVPAWLVLSGWIVLQFVNGPGSVGQETAETGGVAYAAHIGGFFAGVLLILAFKAFDTLRSPAGGAPRIRA
jgi:membrane associated rhomboid family serine protease